MCLVEFLKDNAQTYGPQTSSYFFLCISGFVLFVLKVFSRDCTH